MYKNKASLTILFVVLALAALACTCTNIIPEVDPPEVDFPTIEAPDLNLPTVDAPDNDAPDGQDTGGETGGESTSGESGEVQLVEGIPVPADNENLFSTRAGGALTVSFSTSLTLEEAADFYKSELAKLGYELDQEFISNQAGSLIFSNSDGDLVVGLAPNPLSGGTTVAITSE